MFRTSVTNTGAVLALAAVLAAGCGQPPDQGPQRQPGGAPASAVGTPPPESTPPQSPAELRTRVERLLAGTPITFEPESAQVTPHGQQAIVELSEMLSSPPEGVRVEIIGYTEPGLDQQRAERLSRKRAEAVATQLAQQGAPPKILHTRGAGFAPPDSGPARRVDVRIS